MQHTNLKFLNKRTALISLVSLTLSSFALSFVLLNNKVSKPPPDAMATCQRMVNEKSAVNPAQLSQLQAKEGAEKAAIRKALGEPYCILPKSAIRSGVITEREAYKTDKDARLIVSYEGDRYLGYGLESPDASGFWPFSNDRSAQPGLKQIDIKEIWEIQSGESIAGHRIVGGLGDVSIAVKGEIEAPADGVVEGNFTLATDKTLIDNPKDCILYSSPQMPAYLLKLCGLKDRNLGEVKAGEAIGKTRDALHLSLLTYRPDDNQSSRWIYVSPSVQLIESLLPEA